MTSSEPLTLNQVLRLGGIEPKEVLVFRHRPKEASLNRRFSWIAAERPDLFDCYQSTHGANTESALTRARYLASFIRYRPKQALFVGFYDVVSHRSLTVAQCLGRPLHRELMSLGLEGMKATAGRSTVLEFKLALTEWQPAWRGRLVVGWPGLERSWYRWADRNEFPIEAIAEENLLTPAMPPWEEITLAWNELGVLPSSWRTALSHWRGIYLIIDQSDGGQYVGSAYGTENIFQRWLGYSRTGHGGNKLLRSRDPVNLRFSILQRVSPDLPEAEVVRIEATWKERLRTRAPYGLNDN
ncbi:GIY-YIG nuclease family protein [Sphingosinicella sp.]|uniref:GIY-YIG nuclease family protein n=1 Tax=Sphingosinicella sp. TaxID=1917971 RepID=UPI0040381055